MLLMLAALLALQSAGANGASGNAPVANAPGATRARPTSCGAIEIRADRDRRDRHRFSATRIVELRFGTRLSRHPQREHTLRLRLYTPSGFLYQVLSVPVGAGRNGPRRLEARLPVAGTSIMASGLYGRWRVVPHLDDSLEACGSGRRFVIRP
jgi:hypothetical protein